MTTLLFENNRQNCLCFFHDTDFFFHYDQKKPHCATIPKQLPLNTLHRRPRAALQSHLWERCQERTAPVQLSWKREGKAQGQGPALNAAMTCS